VRQSAPRSSTANALQQRCAALCAAMSSRRRRNFIGSVVPTAHRYQLSTLLQKIFPFRNQTPIIAACGFSGIGWLTH
jgi:hypothetical protein